MNSSSVASIVVLSGGVGGARFLRGALAGIRADALPGVAADATVTTIVNTADDLWLHGLKICPDLDSVMYTLGDAIDPDRGWGRREETWHAREELAAYGVDGSWFGLGDRDLATHLVRTQMLQAGYPLHQVTAALCARWTLDAELVPMTDDRVETHVAVDDPASPSGQRVMHFQEYWVRLRAEVPVRGLTFVGLSEATPAPGVLEAIAAADLILLPPSNPIVSVGPILGVPGVREAIDRAAAPVLGVSPIIGDSHVLGMARQMLQAHDVEVSATGVAGWYAARAHGGLLDGWLIAEEDADQVPAVTGMGIACRAVPLWMRTPELTAAMAADLVGLRSPAGGPA